MWVSCSKCGVTVTQSSLKQHMPSQHILCVPQTRGVYEKGEGSSTYVVSFPSVLQSVRCPLPRCPAVAHRTGRLRENFVFRYFWYQIAMVPEGKEPMPCCNLCGMHMPAGWLIKHLWMAQRDRNTQMKWKRRNVEIVSNCTGETFSLTGRTEQSVLRGFNISSIGGKSYIGW